MTYYPDIVRMIHKNQPGGFVGLDENGLAVGLLIARTAAAADLDDIELEEGEIAYANDLVYPQLRVGNGSQGGRIINLPVSLTTEQIFAISNPDTSLIVFNIDTKKLNFYTGLGWCELNCTEIPSPSSSSSGS